MADEGGGENSQDDISFLRTVRPARSTPVREPASMKCLSVLVLLCIHERRVKVVYSKNSRMRAVLAAVLTLLTFAHPG